MCLTRYYTWKVCRKDILFHAETAPRYLHFAEMFIIAICLARGWVCFLSNLGEILSIEFLVLFLVLAMFGLTISLDALSIDDFRVFPVNFY